MTFNCSTWLLNPREPGLPWDFLGAESGAALIRSTMLCVFVIKLFVFLSISVFMFERELLMSDCDDVLSLGMHLFWFAWAVIRSFNCCNLLFMFVESWEICFETESANVLKCCNNIDTFAVISLHPPQHHHPTPSLFLIPTHLSWNQFMHKLHWVMLPPVFKLQSSTQYLSLLVSASFALLVDGLLLDAPVAFLWTDAMFLSVPAVSAHARAVILAIVMLSSPSLVYVESSCERENVEFNVSPINNVLQSELSWELGITFSLSQTVSGSLRTWTQCEQFSLLVSASVFLRPHTLRASLFIAFETHSAADSTFRTSRSGRTSFISAAICSV